MTSPIRTERHDNVLVVISDNPPVNALGQAVRAGLKDAIGEALADDSVRLPDLPGVVPQRGFSRYYPTGPQLIGVHW